MDTKTHDGTDCMVMATNVDLHFISATQLANLGVDEIAFVKPVVADGSPAFAIYAADGTQMGIATSALLAAAAIIQHDMVPSLVH